MLKQLYSQVIIESEANNCYLLYIMYKYLLYLFINVINV
jgi:hypothetical protein